MPANITRVRTHPCLEALARLPFITHPHNIVLQLLLAWGLVASALIFLLAALAARRMLQRIDAHTLPLFCAAVILAAYAMIDGALYNVHPVAIFAACVGVAIARRPKRSSLEQGSTTTGGESRQSI